MQTIKIEVSRLYSYDHMSMLGDNSQQSGQQYFGSALPDPRFETR